MRQRAHRHFVRCQLGLKAPGNDLPLVARLGRPGLVIDSLLRLDRRLTLRRRGIGLGGHLLRRLLLEIHVVQGDSLRLVHKDVPGDGNSFHHKAGSALEVEAKLHLGRRLPDLELPDLGHHRCLVLLVLPAQGLLSGLADRSTVLRREGVARLAPLLPSRRRGGIDREGEGHLGLRTRDIHATGDNPDPGLVESRPHLVLEIGHRVDGRKLLLFGRRFLGLGGRLRLASL